MDQELGAVLATLMFFGSGDRAAAVASELKPAGTLQEVAATMHRMFPDAVVSYAQMGRVLERAVATVAGSSGAGQPRRNTPCPCGSGRKFKRCCGKDR